MSTLNSSHANDEDLKSMTRIFESGLIFQCPICKKDFQDPRILCSNGHSFCHDCIKVTNEKKTTTVFIFFLFKNILPADGVLKCPICHESRRLASVQEIGQLTKNHTLASLKQAEQHRLAQLGICELCNKRSAYGRCYHCRALACFRCMDDHERILATEQAKDYAELVKIRNTLTERISQWDKKLTDSKETIQQTIHNDAEKQIKEIQGKK